MSRIGRDEYFLKMAALTASRSTCFRRSVGCVLVSKIGHVLSTGYNGVARGQPHCNEPTELYLDGTPRRYGHACEGAMAKSGSELHKCEAIHAEQNALLQCKDVWAIDTCYSTASPCIHCVKLLLNTSCERVAFLDEYPQPEARELWLRAGRTWDIVFLS